ncbi:hypothetical protein B0H12DRAFT_1113587 [Mycena haematopus]|nr:hypothetical protein B0H12DRAFT_1113587 [Mycena haematopus]
MLVGRWIRISFISKLWVRGVVKSQPLSSRLPRVLGLNSQFHCLLYFKLTPHQLTI